MLKRESESETIRLLRAKLDEQFELNRDLHLKNSILNIQHQALLNQLTVFDQRLDATKVYTDG